MRFSFLGALFGAFVSSFAAIEFDSISFFILGVLILTILSSFDKVWWHRAIGLILFHILGIFLSILHSVLFRSAGAFLVLAFTIYAIFTAPFFFIVTFLLRKLFSKSSSS